MLRALLLLALLGIAAPLSAQAGAPPLVDDDARIVALAKGVIQRHLSQTGTPGAVFAVVRDDRVLAVEGMGIADAPSGRSMTADTRVRIGSVSKTFTFTLAMMLAEAGRLDLGADVNGLLKSYRVADGPGGPITMRHLMAHRGGFEDSFGVFTHRDAANMPLSEAIARDAPARVIPAGARTSYSNWGSSLAALVVEDIEGEAAVELVRRRLLLPLGMTASSFASPAGMPAAERARLATPHRLAGRSAIPVAWMQIGPHAPSGALVSTAGDMARWMRLHLSGGSLDGVRILSPEAHALMLTRPFPDRPGAPDLLHGFMSRDVHGLLAYGHGGTTEGFQTSMLLVPELGLGVFVSANAVTPGLPLAEEIAGLVVAMLRPPMTSAGAAAPANLAAFAGTYLGNRIVFSRFEKLITGLGAVMRVEAVDGGILRVTDSSGSADYRPTGAPDRFVNARGEVIAFAREGTRVVTLTHPSGVMSFDRIGFWASPMAFNLALGLGILLAASTLLAIWKRSGQPVRGIVPAWLALGPPAAAILVLLLAGLLVAITIAASGGDIWDRLVDWPPPEIQVLRVVAHLVALAAALGLVALVPLWRRPLATLGRRIHVTLLVVVLVVFTLQLAEWNVILAPTS